MLLYQNQEKIEDGIYVVDGQEYEVFSAYEGEKIFLKIGEKLEIEPEKFVEKTGMHKFL